MKVLQNCLRKRVAVNRLGKKSHADGDPSAMFSEAELREGELFPGFSHPLVDVSAAAGER